LQFKIIIEYKIQYDKKIIISIYKFTIYNLFSAILSIKWIFSTNHKNIGTLYFLFGIWSGIIGSSLRILIRLELRQINSIINNNQLYNVIVTIHAFIIIFFYNYTNCNWRFWKLINPLNNRITWYIFSTSK